MLKDILIKKKLFHSFILITTSFSPFGIMLNIIIIIIIFVVIEYYTECMNLEIFLVLDCMSFTNANFIKNSE